MINVVQDYSREKALAEGSKRAKGTLVVSPITGELVPVDEMQQHMRTHLIDPRYGLPVQRFRDDLSSFRQQTLLRTTRVSCYLRSFRCLVRRESGV